MTQRKSLLGNAILLSALAFSFFVGTAYAEVCPESNQLLISVSIERNHETGSDVVTCPNNMKSAADLHIIPGPGRWTPVGDKLVCFGKRPDNCPFTAKTRDQEEKEVLAFPKAPTQEEEYQNCLNNAKIERAKCELFHKRPVIDPSDPLLGYDYNDRFGR